MFTSCEPVPGGGAGGSARAGARGGEGDREALRFGEAERLADGERARVRGEIVRLRDLDFDFVLDLDGVRLRDGERLLEAEGFVGFGVSDRRRERERRLEAERFLEGERLFLLSSDLLLDLERFLGVDRRREAERFLETERFRDLEERLFLSFSLS